MKRTTLFSAALAAIFLAGCATPTKAPIAADANLQTEIDLVEAKIQQAAAKQYDRLAPKNFEKAKSYRGAAKEKMEKGKSTEDVRSDIAIAKHAIQQVESIGASQGPVIQSVLAARQHAIDAQAPSLQTKKFKAAESELEDMSESMEKGSYKTDSGDIAKIQSLYSAAEVESRKITELRETRNMIEKAEKEGAKKKTPATYETAKSEFSAAERAIEMSPRAPSGYASAVATSNKSARKLSQVLELAVKNNTTEQAALSLWTQNEQIQAANAALEKSTADAAEERARLESAAATEREGLQAEITRTESELENTSAAVAVLQSKNRQYANEEELKMKIEELRKTFNPEEAEVVKNGNNLVVRLKKMQFNTGRSEVKPESYSTLKKVEDLIAAVPAKQITVEGHTDSTGSNQLNQSLSEQRAESVKKYLESQDLPDNVPVSATGYGSDRPLTSNKTKQGRASNRRVDIVIETPVVL